MSLFRERGGPSPEEMGIKPEELMPKSEAAEAQAEDKEVLEMVDKDVREIKETTDEITDILAQPDSESRLSTLTDAAKKKLQKYIGTLSVLSGAMIGGGGALLYAEKLGAKDFNAAVAGLTIAGVGIGAKMGIAAYSYIRRSYSPEQRRTAEQG